MKGTEKIIAHIQADAQAEADAILAKVTQQCDSIREDYDQKAKDSYEQEIAKVKAECSSIIENAGRLDDMESKKELLSVKQELVSDAFELAKKKILDLPADKYTAFLAGLAAKASSSHAEEIKLNASDAKKYGAEVVKAANKLLNNGRLTLARETGDFSGGLILLNGNIEVNCTVELLVELCRGEMSADIARVLFG